MANPIEPNPKSQRATFVVLALSILLVAAPVSAWAFSLWGILSGAAPAIAEASAPSLGIHDLQTPALYAATNLDPNPAKGGGDITIVDNVALLAESGPEGTLADIQNNTPNSDQISLYVVRNGDTLGGIARMFDVTTNTILWANNLKSSKDIHPGDQLVILPITGVKHTVTKGETLASLAKKYKGDVDEIASYNGLAAGATVAVGDVLIIPDGVEAAALVSTSGRTAPLKGAGGPIIAGYYASPLSHYIRTQGLHGYNGVDLGGNPSGTSVMASASGTVMVARSSGYNGGYGKYVVMKHPNGTQTVYAHLSRVIVDQGQSVVQGQIIGYTGMTGRTFGPHLHFEIRGAANPF